MTGRKELGRVAVPWIRDVFPPQRDDLVANHVRLAQLASVRETRASKESTWKNHQVYGQDSHKQGM
ncbi:unnamed protein product [Amoebophrya sp. A25]|nr:unnamed protein product [Amoebophrya sp. A25]|eukprot:GSA25T00016741001.1